MSAKALQRFGRKGIGAGLIHRQPLVIGLGGEVEGGGGRGGVGKRGQIPQDHGEDLWLSLPGGVGEQALGRLAYALRD